jgi:hypothetical protein
MVGVEEDCHLHRRHHQRHNWGNIGRKHARLIGVPVAGGRILAHPVVLSIAGGHAAAELLAVAPDKLGEMADSVAVGRRVEIVLGDFAIPIVDGALGRLIGAPREVLAIGGLFCPTP